MQKKIIFNIVLLSLFFFTVQKSLGQYTEYEVKGLFLYRFAQYIEWPKNSSISDTTIPFRITVIGENPFGSTFENLLKTEKIKGKNIQFERVELNNLSRCDLLFISKSEAENIDKIIKMTKGLNVVLVSDSDGFADKGVFINFYLKEDKVRFEINKSVAEQKGFRFSSRLLKQARIVE